MDSFERWTRLLQSPSCKEAKDQVQLSIINDFMIFKLVRDTERGELG